MIQNHFNSSHNAHGNYDTYHQKRRELFMEYELDNERLKDYDEEDEFVRHGFLEYNRHCQLASLAQPQSSTPLQEPWMDGPPKFTYYTEVELPVIDLLPYDISTDPIYKNDPRCIFIPSEGPSSSPIISEYVAQIVGRGGDWLKKITEESGVHYIWYNNNPSEKQPAPAWGSFQIWGPVERLEMAKQLLNKQIQYVIGKINSKFK
jgi:hypothetical protein